MSDTRTISMSNATHIPSIMDMARLAVLCEQIMTELNSYLYKTKGVSIEHVGGYYHCLVFSDQRSSCQFVSHHYIDCMRWAWEKEDISNE